MRQPGLPDATGWHFKREQRKVAIRMGAALCISLAALTLASVLGGQGSVQPFPTRLDATLKADVWVVGWLAATIANVARLRFFSEQDIAGAGQTGGSDRVRQAGAIAQNTLEQVVLAIATHAIVTATIARSQAMVLTMVALFVVGRVLFWSGYKRGASGRALGFALTFYPSVLGLLASGAALLLG